MSCHLILLFIHLGSLIVAEIKSEKFKTLAITRLWGGDYIIKNWGKNDKCGIVNLINYYKLGTITIINKNNESKDARDELDKGN